VREITGAIRVAPRLPWLSARLCCDAGHDDVAHRDWRSMPAAADPTGVASASAIAGGREPMELLTVAPAAWDDRIASPMLSEGFAEASRCLGFRPLFVENEQDRALVLLRRIPVPLLDRVTGRAKVYVSRGDPAFLEALIDRLAALGLTHMRIGDERHGLGGPPPSRCGARATPYDVFLIDAAHRSDAELLWVPSRTPVELADIVLSRTKVRFQERVLLPLWERAHPLYLRAFGRAS
jgi:hypothetical protein